MKGYKKTVSVLLALTLILSFAPLAQADQTGKLTITKYKMRDVSEANAPNDGQQAGTGTNPAIPASATPLAGIGFTLTKMVKSDTVGVGILYTAEDSTETWYVKTATVLGPLYTNASGVVVFDNLARGLYYVEELPSNKVTDPVKPFFVSMPTYIDNAATPEGYSPIWDVWAYPKNEDIQIDKVITTASGDFKGQGVAIGDIVTWKIVVDVPTDLANAKKYDIVDKLSTGLEYLSTTAVNGLIAGSVEEDLLGTSFYTQTPASATPGNDGITLRWSFDPSKFEDLSALGLDQIEIIITTKVLASASLNSAIPNHAELEYRNQFYDESDPSTEVTRTPELDPRVYTGGIQIFKHDSVNETEALSGAQFMLIEKLSSNWQTDRDNPLAFKSAVMTSDANGLIEFKGIPYGGAPYARDPILEANILNNSQPNDTLYWLIEVSAPAGYRTPSGGWQVVTINGSSWDNSEVVNPLDVGVKVPNVKGFQFPLTGGLGTLIFILAGIALVGASYGFRKLGKKEEQLV